MDRSLPILRGRGAHGNPAHRFERLHLELSQAEEADDVDGRRTGYLVDAARTVLTRNHSPDIGFDWSLNPYRGCEHGCVYCYARPTHEYLGFSAGLDFESRILVKSEAPELLERALGRESWSATTLVLSGVTDPYQTVERRLRLTRRCLEVLERTGHPVAVVTKSRLVERDMDLLASLARRNAAHVTLSITTLNRRLQRTMEPRASPPEHRLEAIRTLARAGIPVSVNVAPVIPGLTDHEIPAILEAAAAAGACGAGMVMLRLPGAVEPLFIRWLEDHVPDRAERVLNRLREMHGGRLYDSRFGHRMRGSGPHAEQLRDLFRLHRRRLGMEGRSRPLSASAFRRPEKRTNSSTRGALRDDVKDELQLNLLTDPDGSR